MYSTGTGNSSRILRTSGETKKKIAFAQEVGHASPVDRFTNEHQVPTQKIEEAAITFARPRMYGSVSIDLILLPTAIFEVAHKTEFREVTRPSTVTKDEGPIVPSNDRVNKLRDAIREVAPRLRLVLKPQKLIFHFSDGMLLKLEVVDVQTT